MAKDREQTRQLLFSATLDLIAEKGFTGTTVDEIVERAGVAKGTVYYHFKSKAELVEALIAQHLRPLAEQFAAAASSSNDPAEQIRALVRTELEFIRDDRAFAKLLITEMWREDRVWRETLDILWEDALSVVRRVIQDGVDAGEFAQDTDPGVASSAVFGMVAVVALSWLMRQPDRSIEEIAANLQRLAVNSLS